MTPRERLAQEQALLNLEVAEEERWEAENQQNQRAAGIAAAQIRLRTMLDSFTLEPETPDSFVNVPLEPTGPPNDPRDYAVAYMNLTDDDMCPICQERFAANPDEVCMRLNNCNHLVHLECLDVLINTVYTGRLTVGCPCCRADICYTRTYRANPSVDNFPPVDSFREIP
jgi:hypothetical protein